MKAFFRVVIATFTCACSFITCQEQYSLTSVEAGVGGCPATKDYVERIRQGVDSLIENVLLPTLIRPWGCGGPGWRRTAFLNTSDPTQTCPPAWALITTPRRSCARPSSAGSRTCYSAMFPTQGIRYSHVCGRIIGYQFGEPQAFFGSEGHRIDERYVDGVSLTYGSLQQHIWTFACALDEAGPYNNDSRCSCTDSTRPNTTPSFVGNDYFCETGVPPGQGLRHFTFYADDPLWDGQGCGSTSTCCTFNNPPWFCKQLPQSTNADLEVRLCSFNYASAENTPVELIEIYVK